MALSIERVEPIESAEDAGVILREAWAPPVIHYTTEYLRWQLGFPGAPAIAVRAVEDGVPAGFMALSPRRFRFRGVATEGYVLSFLGVRPSFQGRGLAGKLYDTILRVLRETGLPAVVFVESHGAAAQRVLFKTVERLDFKLKRLGQVENYGFMPRRREQQPAAGVVATAARDLDGVLAAIDACGGDRVLRNAPDRAMLEHYQRDPRPRTLLVVEEAGGVTAVGMVCLTEIVTKQGLDRVVTLDSAILPEPSAERLSALVRGAAGAFAERATSPAVSVPNLATIDPELMNAVRLRRTGASYDGFVIHGEGHAVLDAEVTSLEVV